MKKLTLFLSGLLIAVGLTAVAVVPSGGFPSRPFFQSVGIGTTAPAAVGATSQTGNQTFTSFGQTWTIGGTGVPDFRICNSNSSNDCIVFNGTGVVTAGALSAGVNDARFNVNGAVGAANVARFAFMKAGTVIGYECAATGAGGGDCITGDAQNDISFVNTTTGAYHWSINGTNLANLSLGVNATFNVLGTATSAIVAGDGSTTTTARVESNANATAGSQARMDMANAGTIAGYLCLATGTGGNDCFTGDAQNDLSMLTSGGNIHFVTAGVSRMDVGTGGPTVGGQALCQANGTNCPAAATTTSTTATGTATGCTAALTTTFRYTKFGNMAVVAIDNFQCTSNATSFTFTGAVPAAFQPTRTIQCVILGNDNGNNQPIIVQLASGSTTASMFTSTSNTGLWTAANGKGIAFATNSCSYVLN